MNNRLLAGLAAAALLAATLVGLHSASAGTLIIDGGVIQVWEQPVDLPTPTGSPAAPKVAAPSTAGAETAQVQTTQPETTQPETRPVEPTQPETTQPETRPVEPTQPETTPADTTPPSP
ncbi:hypothetical protein ACPCG0_03825 [Propionibacteriaceae bacterium Y1923]|uniref:hypothetical protein n=1 Tax=Aestuariimicrobium sp. Y1814 TaxID=3418742 RepID=UPI003C205917